MTAIMETRAGREAYLAEFERFERGCVGADRSWLRPVRKAAIARFAEVGFPTTRHEEWRYTNVAPIANASFELSRGDGGERATTAELAPYLFDPGEFCRLVFVNGRYSPRLSARQSLAEGVRAESLAAEIKTGAAQLENHLARYAGFEDQPFTALNTAFMEDGALIYVPKGVVVETPIHLLFVSTANGRATVSHPRNLIIAGENSQVTVVETYAGPRGGVYFTNAVTEFAAGQNAIIEHYKVERESDEAFHVSTRQFHQARTSNVSSHTISLNGSLVRNDINTVLDGEGAEATFNGLYLLRGSQHVDNHLRVEHAKPHCNSWQYFKGILDG